MVRRWLRALGEISGHGSGNVVDMAYVVACRDGDFGAASSGPIEASATAKCEGRVAIGAFLAASRQMVRTTSQSGPDQATASPGVALIELLGFADAVRGSQPPRPMAPLTFPVLARFAAKQHVSLGHASAPLRPAAGGCTRAP